MKVAKVMFLWSDKWLDGIVEQNDQFECGYCILFGGVLPFGPDAASRVALDYVKQWYYVDDPGNIQTQKRK